MAYEAKLPEGVTLPEGFKIDTSDERYKALEQLASSQKFSQETFSNLLGIEGRRVVAEHAARASAPAAPAPKPAVPVGWDKMSFAEKTQFALTNPRR
jgi:hypothetical protein